MSASAIRRVDLLRVGLRLLLLQNAWSEGVLQSVGLAYCLVPGLRRVHRTPEALDEAVRRHRAPFNTHPYLAGAVAGAVLRMEADGEPPNRIAGFVRDAMGPLAAMGDPFFRAALAPAASLVAALVALLAGPLAGALALIALFNGPHLLVRIGAVGIGFRDGPQGLARTGSWIGPGRTRALRLTAALAAGLALGALVLELGRAHLGLTLIAALAAGLVCALVLARQRAAWSYVVPLFLAAMVLGEVAI
jgi:mannose/fructose/N-acetylgalactosamine-specific phosphotransferase system component IID